mgnify:CR=1 FL=1
MAKGWALPQQSGTRMMQKLQNMKIKNNKNCWEHHLKHVSRNRMHNSAVECTDSVKNEWYEKRKKDVHSGKKKKKTLLKYKKKECFLQQKEKNTFSGRTCLPGQVLDSWTATGHVWPGLDGLGQDHIGTYWRK